MTTQVAAPVIGTNRVLGAANATSMSSSIVFPYTSAVVTQELYIAPIKMRLTAILGVTRVAGNDGSAVTFAFYKAADGVAVGSGVILHSGTFDVKGTADINQYLTLVTDPATLAFNPGDRFGLVLTGTATSAVGIVQAVFEPRS